MHRYALRITFDLVPFLGKGPHNLDVTTRVVTVALPRVATRLASTHCLSALKMCASDLRTYGTAPSLSMASSIQFFWSVDRFS